MNTSNSEYKNCIVSQFYAKIAAIAQNIAIKIHFKQEYGEDLMNWTVNYEKCMAAQC